MPRLPGLVFLQNYPHEEIWRIFVDGRFWAKEGWNGYGSREPGSLEKDKNEFELNTNFIKEIHKICEKKVKALEEQNPGGM